MIKICSFKKIKKQNVIEAARRCFRWVFPYSFVVLFAVLMAWRSEGLQERICGAGGLAWVVALAVLVLTALLWLCVHHPVMRDRTLAHESSLWKLVALVLVIVSSLFVLVGVAVVCGVDAGNILSDDKADDLTWAIISQYADPGSLGNASRSGRAVALTAAVMGVVLMTGLTTSVIVSMMNQRVDMWKKGLLRYRRTFNRHVVIIGANEQVVTIIKHSIARDRKCLVLILTSRDVEQFRSYIETQLTARVERRVVIYHGLQTAAESIGQLQLGKAREVYILGESVEQDNTATHDAFNIKSLKLINECIASRKDRLKCHVAFEYHSTYGVYKHTGVGKDTHVHVEFLPFSVYEVWARRVLVEGSAGREYEERFKPMQRRMAEKTLKASNDDKPKTKKTVDQLSPDELEAAYGHYEYPFFYKPLGTWDQTDAHRRRKAIDYDSDKRVHLIIIGIHKMGRALAAEAMQLMHFPNYLRDNNLRTTITFIDTNAVDDGEIFKSRYANFFALARHRTVAAGATIEDINVTKWVDPIGKGNGRFHHLAPNFIDIECEFIQGNAASPHVREYLTQIASDNNRICTIACCQSQPQQALATALYLPEAVLKRAIQVLVYQRSLPDLAELLSEGDNVWKRFRKLKPFGMLADCYTDNALDDYRAKLANYFYQRAKHGESIDFEKGHRCVIDHVCDLAEQLGINDKAVEQEWHKVAIAYKWSSIYYVQGFAQKLRAAGSDIDQPPADQARALIEGKQTLLKRLAQTEHNRWVTERLLMGFRPLEDNDKEWRFFDRQPVNSPDTDDNRQTRDERKMLLKDKSRAHLDIASNATVDAVDPLVHLQDENNIRALPIILALDQARKAKPATAPRQGIPIIGWFSKIRQKK